MKRHCTRKAVLISMLLASSGFGALAQARVPNDTFYSQQWYLRQINAEAAWDKTTGSSQVVVAVIDTGVDIEHEDLRENIWTNAGELPENGVDDDKNGFVDDVHGWNFFANSNDVSPRAQGSSEEGFIHGTLVASLIAARGGNDIGVAGVAWNVKIMPLTALDGMGFGSSDDVADAIRYAVSNGAQIINLSLEGYTNSTDITAALAYARSKGVLTVAASGNAPDNPTGYDLDILPVYPACLSSDPSLAVMAVGGTDTLDQKSPYSNYGACVNVMAPSFDLFGARPVSLLATSTGAKSGYEGGFSGTSLAAPLVAGAAALLKSVHPLWQADELKGRIMVSAAPINGTHPEYQGKLGKGRLDLAAALSDVATSTVAGSVYALSATIPGRPTRVRVMSGVKVSLELQPFGANDTRGARTVFIDTDKNGIPEIFVAPASGHDFTWVLYGLDGKELKRGLVTRDLKDGTLVASVQGGAVVADAGGGRAWGVADSMKTTLFYPYGTAYRAGLDLLAVSGAAAFAPRGGGGHLMITDAAGRRLVSVFPFGTSARGRWSLARLPQTTARLASLVLSGPVGNRFLDSSKLGPLGWRDISLKDLEAAKPVVSGGSSSGDASVRVYDEWPR